MIKKPDALVIGANGGIGQELVRQLSCSSDFTTVHGVSRSLPTQSVEGVEYAQIDYSDEQEVADYCKKLTQQPQRFSLIVCCIGVLHGTTENDVALKPEKRLEDLSVSKLSGYFFTNAVLPGIWLKYIEPLVSREFPVKVVFFSARVGSITDNQLGGWYGYRASKAALNMLIKTAQIEYQRRISNLALVCYHPGTVDTELSKPFQANVARGKLFTVQFTVNCLLGQLAQLHAQDGPHYVDWDGKSIPW
ncbi:MAG: NAD(P)-dependent dehydrogenase (short-subunit alcohol dehydrogenase family) [Paraglaciecola sp.]|jgi:NAD(P)-dependent dehydrogenase (short-subunit alcohol dehydrogenase family)